jgi:hypothetical protein
MRQVVRVAGLVLGLTVAIADASEPEYFFVGIALDAPPPWVEHLASAVIAEVAAIWRPHGVSIIQSRDAARPVDVRISVKCQISRRASTALLRNGGEGGGLGGISFETGEPSRAIALDPEAIVATLSPAGVNGRNLSEWPQAFADLVVARALGRVLAHEVGHFLLAFPAHTPDGLMRSGFDGRELAYVDRRRFALSPQLLPRLRHQLAQRRSDRVLANDSRE